MAGGSRGRGGGLVAGLLVVAAAFGVGGCGDGLKLEWLKLKPRPEPAPPPEQRVNPVLADTIGSQVVLSGARPLSVRGFGLVIGLGDQGSTECPSALRAYLIEFLTKTYKLDASGPQEDFSASGLIDSPDTAPVEVFGMIPAGAPRGTRFDVFVQAATGTQTRSLEGGLLLPCELKLVDLSYRSDRLIAGRTMARAGGPIFSSPPPPEAQEAAQEADPRRAMVLGGGHSVEARNIRLVLMQPSYSAARRIERRINERFGHAPKTSEAMSKAHVEVRTPAAYADDPLRFARLAAHVYLYPEPAFYEAKLGELSAIADGPEPPCDDLALAWEGIGRVGVRQIQPLYGHADPRVSFAACQAGLRLDDAAAVEVLGRIAADPGHPRRITAVAELGRARIPGAAAFLTPLLDVEDPQVRIAAYEALLSHRHPSIRTRRFESALDPFAVNLWLDTVPSSARPLVYVRQTGEPRIALFGERTPCRTPLFYSHPDGLVTLNAGEEAADITLFRRMRHSSRVSDPLRVPARVADVIASMADVPVQDESGQVRGVGLNYAQVVQVITGLCAAEAVPATLVMQPPPAPQRFASDALPERPEAADRRGDETADERG